MAHGLLNSMAVVLGALTLLEDGDQLTAEDREDLIRRAVHQATFVAASLKDMVLGLPPGATALLEELDRERHRPDADVLPFRRGQVA